MEHKICIEGICVLYVLRFENLKWMTTWKT